jgi:error-prone DNA polymerase
LPDSAFEKHLDHCLALWLPEADDDLLTAHWVASHFPGRSWMAINRNLGPDDQLRMAGLISMAETAGLPVTACGDVQMHIRPRRILHSVWPRRPVCL